MKKAGPPKRCSSIIIARNVGDQVARIFNITTARAWLENDVVVVSNFSCRPSSRRSDHDLRLGRQPNFFCVVDDAGSAALNC